MPGGTLEDKTWTGKVTSDFWLYSESVGDWLVNDQLPSMPEPRTNHGMASLNHGRQLVLFGGQTGMEKTDKVLHDTWVYDNRFSLHRGGWRRHVGTGPADYWRHRTGFAMASFGGDVVLFGGLSSHDDADDKFVEHFLADTWVFSAPASASDGLCNGGETIPLCFEVNDTSCSPGNHRQPMELFPYKCPESTVMKCQSTCQPPAPPASPVGWTKVDDHNDGPLGRSHHAMTSLGLAWVDTDLPPTLSSADAVVLLFGGYGMYARRDTNVSAIEVCKVGDSVMALWPATIPQIYWPATIESIDGDLVTVNWSDGDMTNKVVDLQDVKKGSTSCASGHDLSL